MRSCYTSVASRARSTPALVECVQSVDINLEDTLVVDHLQDYFKVSYSFNCPLGLRNALSCSLDTICGCVEEMRIVLCNNDVFTFGSAFPKNQLRGVYKVPNTVYHRATRLVERICHEVIVFDDCIHNYCQLHSGNGGLFDRNGELRARLRLEMQSADE